MRLHFTVPLLLSVPLSAQTTTLVSVASDGTFANDDARVPSLSADGRLIAFEARATNLVPGDDNGIHDVFVHVLSSGVTELVSVALDGSPGNGQSGAPSACGDGRFVAFESRAADLVVGDTNGARDVFVRDRQSGSTRRVSVTSAGLQGDGDSGDPSISADGRFVAFSSTSTNLVPGDTNGVEDVFVHDLRTGATWRASASAQGVQGSGASREPALSLDGTHLAFTSAAPELVPGDTNAVPDVFVLDLVTGALLRASVGPGGSQANDESGTPALSADGRVVAFRSRASDLAPADTNHLPDVFVHDLASQQTVLASVNSSGVQADQGGLAPVLSADGTQVAFLSFSTNMGTPPGMDEVYVRDLQLGLTEQVSVSTAGEGGDYFSNLPTISADGRLVAFMSLAQNLVPDPTPYTLKVFLRDRAGCTPSVASYCAPSSTSPGCVATIHATGTPSLSAPQAFEVASGPVPGAVLGVACVGVVGPDATPIGTQGGLVCVGSFARSAPLLAGGTAGACDGELRLSLADLVATEPAIAEPSGMVWVQFWFRDAGGSDGFGLSNGLWFQTCP